MPLFIEDLQAAVEALGTDHPGIVFGIASTAWENAEQRDSFLRQLNENA